jgi:2-polyprenyl-3-methyl-5-hydroxy-6-metoxy-1,4-benzoquinol methylase
VNAWLQLISSGLLAPGRPRETAAGVNRSDMTSVPVHWPLSQTPGAPSKFPGIGAAAPIHGAYSAQMADDPATVEYFEQHAHDYSAGRLRPAVAFVKEHGPPNASLIDIGCGTGNVLAHIAKVTGVSNLVGLDVSQRCVELTRQKVAAEVYQASVLDQATVEKLRGRFDFAVMAAVLHHLVGPTRRRSGQLAQRALSNALTLVKPGGYLIVMEPTFTPAAPVFVLFWVKTALSKIFHRRLPVGDYWNNIGAPVVSYYSSEQIQSMLREAPLGAEIVLVDDVPQLLTMLADLLVSKSNTTIIVRRSTEPRPR